MSFGLRVSTFSSPRRLSFFNNFLFPSFVFFLSFSVIFYQKKEPLECTVVVKFQVACPLSQS